MVMDDRFRLWTIAMSQILDKPTTNRTPTTVRRKSAPRVPLSSTVPDITLKARVYERKRSKPGFGTIVSQKALLFGFVMAVTYASVSLIGQVKVESARQQRLEAHGRAVAAQTAEGALSSKVDRLASSDAIDAYAVAAKMTQVGEIDAEAPKERRVALR
jgi:hypothetical protein